MSDLMRLLIAAACLQQLAEDAYLRPTLEFERPWAIVRADYPFARPLDWIFASPFRVTALLAARGAATLALILTPRPLDAFVLICGTWLWGLRWRGTVNGGSDQMTMVVLIGTFVTLLGPEYERWGLTFVTAHLVMSFVVAGVVKIKNRDWRRGAAPAAFLSEVRGRAIGAPVAITLAWMTMAFELLFPLGLVNLSLALGITVLGVVFHVANAYLLGLNRFLFAWAAAYPAFLAVAERQWLSSPF